MAVDRNATEVVFGDSAGRISRSGNELLNGKCLLRIMSVTTEDFEMWSCTLFHRAGGVFTGEMNIVNGEGLSTVSFQSVLSLLLSLT